MLIISMRFGDFGESFTVYQAAPSGSRDPNSRDTRGAGVVLICLTGKKTERSFSEQED